MLFKISNNLLYAKWPILCLSIPVLQSKQVILIRSTPTNLRCIADQTRSKYDQPSLYCRPPRCTPLNIRPVESEIIPDHFSTGTKTYPLTTTSQSGPDQPPLYLKQTYALTDQGPLIVDPSIFSRAGESGG